MQKDKYNVHLPLLLLLSVVAFFTLLPQPCIGQVQKPKVALVLSGGGAKGIAHIPLLQTLDSLHIVPDMLIGTSMGSLVGAMYAMGYSGDSIASIVRSSNWDELLGGKIPLNHVGVEEKSEYNKYLIGFDVINRKPNPSYYLLNDQYLMEFLSVYTSPVYNVTDFDQLSIPFRSVTCDIVNGKEMVLASGALSLAMRASMSIPGIFEPVEYKNTLLVDGGLLNNFPTDIAKEMGADIIIGSNVSSATSTAEDLHDFSTILSQSMMLGGYSIFPANRQLATIYVNHSPHLTFTTADFNKSCEIYAEGKIAVAENIAQLASLADTLKAYQQRPHVLPYTEDHFVFDTIVYKNISPDNLPLVMQRANIEAKKVYTKKELSQLGKNMMGTNLFRKIDHQPFLEEGNKGLLITGYENSDLHFDASLHYDDYRGVGLVGTFSGRNVLGAASQILLSLDIAEQPKAMLQYQKIFGKQKNWWWKSEARGVKLNQLLFLDGKEINSQSVRSYKVINRINKNINPLHSYIGLGINYGNINLKPSAFVGLDDNIYSIDDYKSNTLSLDMRYEFTSMNKVFYPTKGKSFEAVVTRSLLHDVDATYTTSNVDGVSGRTSQFTKLQLAYKKRYPLGEKNTFIFNANAGFILDDASQDDELSFFDIAYSEFNFLGGNLPIQKENSFAFQGLNEDELSASQFVMLQLGLQYNPFNRCYVTPQFNMATVGFDDIDEYASNLLSPSASWQLRDETSLLMSAALTLSYESILGPIDFCTSWINDSNKVNFFLSLGIPFNR